jgi:hypothetical protein
MEHIAAICRRIVNYYCGNKCVPKGSNVGACHTCQVGGMIKWLKDAPCNDDGVVIAKLVNRHEEAV